MKTDRHNTFLKLIASPMVRFSGLLLLAILFEACDTSSSVRPYKDQTFIKLYGSDGSEQGSDIAVLPDDGFVIVGSSTSRNASNRNQDIYLVRTDSVGEIVWEAWIDAFGQNHNESANAVTVNREANTVYVCGETMAGSGETENQDVYVASISLSDGMVISEHTYGEPLRDEEGTDIFETEEGFFITSTSQDENGVKFFLVETDSELEALPNRSRYIPYNSNAMSYSARSYDHSDEYNPFICFGTSDRGTNGSSTLWYQAFTYKSTSNILGTVAYYGTSEANEVCTDAAKTSNGGYVLAGYRQGISSNKEMIVRIDPENLQMRWIKVYGNEYDQNVRDCSIIQTADRGYLISSTIELPPPKNDEISLLKVDRHGNEEWRNIFGSDENDAASKVVQLKDNSYVIIGTIGFDINPNSESKMALLKVNSSGELIPN